MNLHEFFSRNRLWGKLIGAFIGYQIAGPAGALIGILIGNFFDRLMFKRYTQPYWLYRIGKRQHTQQVFFEATFSIIGHIAKADGRVSREEINMTTMLMHDMGLNRTQREAAQRFFNQGKAANFDLNAMLNKLISTCQDNPELLKLFTDIQYRAAQTDGLSEKKIHVLDIIFSYLGFAPLRQQHRFYEDFGQYTYSQQSNSHSYNRSRAGYQSARPKPENALTHAYAMLELNPNANKQETKRAYRQLISRNHPDKLIAQGLPEEMIKLANDKTQKITKAYEVICAAKGW